MSNVFELRREKFRFFICAVAIGSVLSVLSSSLARATERTFLGIEVNPISGVYLVTKDVNVRSRPETKSKKLGSFKEGTKVNAVGKAKGGAGWIAVTKDGKDFGFVYSPILLPLIDGALKAPILGKVNLADNGTCTYKISYRGKSEIEEENLVFSDYEIEYQCNDSGRRYRFYAPMFMIETPLRKNRKPIYQISIDLLELESGYDEIFSTTFLYLRDKKEVAYDGVTYKDMGRKLEAQSWASDDFGAALKIAAETAPLAWNDKVWETLASVHAGNGD